MKKRQKKITKPIGLVPGTIVFVGEKKTENPYIYTVSYNESQYFEKKIDSLKQFQNIHQKNLVNWINVTGLHQVDIIESIGEFFELHPIILEDIANTEDHPKIEFFEKYIFSEFKLLYMVNNEIQSEQFAIVLGDNYVLTFVESECQILDFVKDRIQHQKGKITKSGADYLFYSLIDNVVDNYFAVLDKIWDEIESLDGLILNGNNKNPLNPLFVAKRNLLYIRKAVWPLREIIRRMEIEESDLLTASTKIYLKDLYDHIVQIIETVEIQREMLSEMLEVYLTSNSNKMNEIMKVLTIISTIFIPLTFLAGVYGMNFENMPELKTEGGYFVIWGIMIFTGCLMLIFFKKKKWL